MKPQSVRGHRVRSAIEPVDRRMPLGESHATATFFSLRQAHGIAKDKVDPFSRSTKLLCTLCWELKVREWGGTFTLPGEGSGDGRLAQKKGSCHC